MPTAAQKVPSQPPANAQRRSWIARHKILTVLGVSLVAAIVAGYIFAWPLLKWRFHALLATSLAEIQHSPAAVEKLGEPISIPLQPWPSGRVNSDGKKGDARFDFVVVGSKLSDDKKSNRTADAVAQLRMTDGQWGYTELKLTCDDKTSIDLLPGIQARDGNDTPKFDAGASQPAVKAPNMSIDIAIPELPAEPGK
jgi:hypothetical protein